MHLFCDTDEFTCKCFLVTNAYRPNDALTLRCALQKDYEQTLLRVQMQLTAHVIGSRWPYHSNDAQDRLG